MASPIAFGLPFVAVSEFSLLPLPRMTLLDAVEVTLLPKTNVFVPVMLLLEPILAE